jgi:hypothetical protein
MQKSSQLHWTLSLVAVSSIHRLRHDEVDHGEDSTRSLQPSLDTTDSTRLHFIPDESLPLATFPFLSIQKIQRRYRHPETNGSQVILILVPTNSNDIHTHPTCPRDRNHPGRYESAPRPHVAVCHLAPPMHARTSVRVQCVHRPNALGQGMRFFRVTTCVKLRSHRGWSSFYLDRVQ